MLEAGAPVLEGDTAVHHDPGVELEPRQGGVNAEAAAGGRLCGLADKARLDGDYVRTLRRGGFPAFAMDVRCFFRTILSVLRRDGVLEGEQNRKDEK